MDIRLCGRSAVGMRRESNEDAILLWDLAGRVPLPSEETVRLKLTDSPCLVAVMDGMGGAAGGEVASGIVARVLADHARESFREEILDDPGSVVGWLARCAEDAHARIFQRAGEEAELQGMGSTLTAAVLTPERLHSIHVGDTRLYHLRSGTLRQLTVDHTYVQRLVSSGQIAREQVKDHPQRHFLLQSVGAGDALKVEKLVVPLARGDLLLLCTDGLHGPVDGPLLLEILGNGREPAQQTQRLVEEANKAGGPDNISAIVALVS